MCLQVCVWGGGVSGRRRAAAGPRGGGGAVRRYVLCNGMMFALGRLVRLFRVVVFEINIDLNVGHNNPALYFRGKKRKKKKGRRARAPKALARDMTI